MPITSIRHYAIVTSAYWAFTLTDGALRMLVLLHFYTLGYNALQIAMLFLLYEFFGVVTNLLGGWIASHTGLRLTLFAGLGLQIVALLALTWLDPGWGITQSVAWVMTAQALSGIAKDLTKMSAKSAIKLVVSGSEQGTLYRWVSLLTGSKNTLKGAGFFLGGLLLAKLGFEWALYSMAAALMIVFVIGWGLLPREMGRASIKTKFTHLLSRDAAINKLSSARLFLFGARDTWFVVGLPLYLASELGWSHELVGAYLAAWVIGYGIVQASVPRFIHAGGVPTGTTAIKAVLALVLTILLVIGLFQVGQNGTVLLPQLVVTVGLVVFGIVFAVNSAVHSYLVLAYSKQDNVTVDVGFYYMANASGRLLGTIISGLSYSLFGLMGCLLASLLFTLLSAAFATGLPRTQISS